MELTILLLLVGVTQACIRLPNEPSKVPPTNSTTDNKKDKIYLFATEGNWKPYTFQDETSGDSVGFFHDLIAAVCSHCDKKCDTVFIDDHLDKCFNQEELTSSGLMDRHFDACVGWVPIRDILNILNFTSPFLSVDKSRMFTRPGSGVSSVMDIPGKSIGFRQFWFMDKYCARRNGFQVADSDVLEIRIEDGWQDVIQALNEEKVDVVVIPEGTSGTESLVPIGDAFECAEVGYGLIHRKDVQMSWFGECLRDNNRKTGMFQSLCNHWGVDNCFNIGTM
ncbi:unnamed protein product [Owenia fusiformis]|uniref:Solute-binding protein family 3/N-terminal domain-containing protein n=1 Tax=Owenia fusiformis TaxID=6347 RepID=A0A8J1TRR6_OWEFU|nr:unnamed protein product [Owenia fusiformis]